VTTVFLLRHCQYQNDQKVIPFRLPGFPLSEAGQQCARELGQKFKTKNIAAIYTSPVLRAKQTAAIIAKALRLKPVSSPLITELASPYQGFNLDEFNRRTQGAMLDPFHLQDGGETQTQVKHRTSKFINSIRTNHPNQKVIIVSHGDIVMVMSGKTSPYISMGQYFTLAL
jgi:2,3-bisphosphoglycerate-dependent phosphoglycerate mutase